MKFFQVLGMLRSSAVFTVQLKIPTSTSRASASVNLLEKRDVKIWTTESRSACAFLLGSFEAEAEAEADVDARPDVDVDVDGTVATSDTVDSPLSEIVVPRVCFDLTCLCCF